MNLGLLESYLSEIVDWNNLVGLVSRQRPLSVADRLTRQSCELWAFLNARVTPARVADVGSGAGFPGIIWKLLSDSVELTFIERRQKKAAFLERVVTTLRLESASVIHADSADVQRLRDHGETHDVVVTMAVGAPEQVAPSVEGLLRPGGVYTTLIPQEMPIPPRIGASLADPITRSGQHGNYVFYTKR